MPARRSPRPRRPRLPSPAAGLPPRRLLRWNPARARRPARNRRSSSSPSSSCSGADGSGAGGSAVASGSSSPFVDEPLDPSPPRRSSSAFAAPPKAPRRPAATAVPTTFAAAPASWPFARDVASSPESCTARSSSSNGSATRDRRRSRAAFRRVRASSVLSAIGSSLSQQALEQLFLDLLELVL